MSSSGVKQALLNHRRSRTHFTTPAAMSIPVTAPGLLAQAVARAVR